MKNTESGETQIASVRKGLMDAVRASRRLARLSSGEINQTLRLLADSILAGQEQILAANKKDLERMDPTDPKFDRLLLNEDRLAEIARDIRKVAELPSPLGRELESKVLPNGLHLSKVSTPVGVVGMVFESRPNVPFDVFALTFKSGNGVVLKGSRDAHYSNIAIVDLIHRALAVHRLQDACFLAPSDREALDPILHAVGLIDVLIPRGGQGLIQYVRDHAKVPVLETGAGIVHTYFDESGDPEKGRKIIENAKSRRVSVCNALDTLVIHKNRLPDLAFLLAPLDHTHHCTIYADEASFRQLEGKYTGERLFRAKPEDFGTEFLSMKMSVKTVNDLEEALDHIAGHSSKHSEAIIAEDPVRVKDFLSRVDAAVVYANASTAFTDGAQFGLGAEIGISTQKLHARGPMGLQELTSYKWVVEGSGQIRPR